jgi:predicted extracellular nuclease
MAVNAGDIAFVGVNATNPDQFAILALKAIAAEDSFYVTDGGITGSSGAASGYFRATEGFLRYTAPAGGILAGTVILINAGDTSATPPVPLSVSLNGGGSAGSVTLLANSGNATSNFSFSTSGDSLTAYRVSSGTHLTGTPTLIAFIGFGVTPYGSGNPSNSNLPTITNGQVLNVGNLDNAIFTNAANVYSQSISALSSATNFTARDTTPFDLSTLASAPAAPTVSLSLSSTTGSETGQTIITVTATASRAVTKDQTVALAVTGSGITAGDYSLSNSTIIIASGSTSGSVTFTVVDDALVEGTETATLTISSPSSGITLGSPVSQTITLTDNDSPPSVTLSLSAVSGSEAGQTIITVTATATAAVVGSQTVEVGVSGSNITAADYILSNSLITISNGQSSGSVTFTVADDALFEATETATLTLSSPSTGISLGSSISQTISITDNEILITEIHPSGNSSSYNADWFELSNNSASAVSLVGWRMDDNSNAFANSVALRGISSIAAGSSVIFLESDAVGSNDATILANFSRAWFGTSTPPSGFLFGFYGGSGVGLSASTDAVNVFDAAGNLVSRVNFGSASSTASFDNKSGASPVSTLSVAGVNGASFSFNGAETGSPGTTTNSTLPTVLIASTDDNSAEAGLNPGTFRIARTGAVTNALIVTYTVASGSGQASGSDYTPVLNGSATIAAGQSFVDITITPVDDLLVEGPETIVLTLTSSSTYSLGSATASVTITDNDIATATPTIQEAASTTPFLSLPATGSGAASGVINDPTDPAHTLGIDFVIADPDTDVNSLTVTVSSSNSSVVSSSNLNLSGSGAGRNLKISPNGVGLADITLNVSDGINSAAYVIQYAASATSVTPSSTRFFTGTSDASTAVAIDSQFMLVADDENQVLRLYDRSNSGLPIAGFDFTSSLALTDTSGGMPREVDLEASLRVGNRIYWLGSLSNSSSGDFRPNRNRLFATDVSGIGASTSLSYVGRYDNLKADLIGWGDANGYNFTASATAGVIPEAADGSGFNIEGLTIAPNGTTAYLAFRAPKVPTASRAKALIAPITNFSDLVTGLATTASIGAAIELDLGGRGIREIKRSSGGDYLIIAGPADTATGTAPKDFRLFTWSGNAADAPILRSADLTSLLAGGSFESIVDLPTNLSSSSQIQLLVDNGDTDFYNNGTAAKELNQDNFKKFRGEWLTLGTPAYTLPVGALSLSSAYSQNFNSLISTGTTTWTNGSTLSGWYTSRTGTGTSIVANDGSSTSGNLYSYGTTNNPDRALGSVGSGNAAAGDFFWGSRFFNDTGSTISTLYINYAGEQWRNSAAAAQTVDFQYQLGATSLNTGSWTDFNPLDFTSPVTGGTVGARNGNLSTNRTFLSGTLSGLSLAAGQEIWLRWSDSNHTGNDHGLAIDDVRVSINPLPGISISESAGSTSVNEQGATTDTYTLTLNTTPTASVSIVVAAADNQTRLSTDGITFAASLTLSLSDQTPQTITVKAVDDAAIEASPHQGVITHMVSSADSNYNGLSVRAVNVGIQDNDVAPLVTKISQIQGSGSTFNSTYGGTQTIEGIVTRVFPGSTKLNGFYVQEEAADSDGNAATSEAIFVFDSAGLFTGSQGDKVRVTGSVGEYTSSSSNIAGTGSSSLTQLSALTSVVNLGAASLPALTSVTLPIADVSQLERYEGMLVEISAGSNPLVVTETFKLGRYGQVGLSAGERLGQYTQFNAPSVSGYANYLTDLQDGYIILDDGSTSQNPDPVIHARGGQPLSASNPLRGGDTIASITGVLDERFEGYRVQSGTAANFVASNPRSSTAPPVQGTLKIASFNLLNYFNGNGSGAAGSAGGFPTARGANNLAEFERQRAKTIAAVLGLNADIIAYNELENDGYGPSSSAQQLVAGLNGALGVNAYSFITPSAGLLQPDGRFGGDEISVGFFYRSDRVRQAPGSSVAALQSGSFDQGSNRIQRPALAVSFERLDAGVATGEQLTTVVTHLKSKGSSAGGSGDADAGDGQGLSNGSRSRAAAELADWLASSPTGLNDPDVLILGDLNSYLKEDPITTLAARGYQSLYGPDSYSYQFNGQWGSLDHMLASASLAAQLGSAHKWAINSDEAVVLDYNTEFKSASQINSFYNADPFRSSDHDPLLAGFLLNPSNRGAASFTISGSPVVGQTLIAALATSDPDGDGAFAYSWQASANSSDWTVVGTNSSSYSIAPADEGKQLRLVVSYTDAKGFAETITVAAGTVPLMPDLAITALTPSQSEGSIGTTAFAFQISRSGDLSGSSRVAWVVEGSGSNPANAADFALNQWPSGTAVFATGQDNLTITIPVIGDGTVEPDERFRVLLSSASNGRITPATASATSLVLNDDLPAQTFSFTASATTVFEGNAVAIGVITTNVSAGSRLYWQAGGAGITASDFSSGGLNGDVLIGADGRASFTRTIAADAMVDPNETLEIKFFSDTARSLQVGNTINVLIKEPTVGLATDSNDNITGTTAGEHLNGVPSGSSLRGRGSRDELTGQAGDDIFVLGDASGTYYDDGLSANRGTTDMAIIRDFAMGDRILLWGDSSQYTFVPALYNGIKGTRIDLLPPVSGSLPEAIGFVQGATLASLNLANTNQFSYVRL